MSTANEWRMIYEAPQNKPVLVWVPPLKMSPALTVPARFEVGVVHATDPRSGKVVQKYANTCRWTPLPKPPRQRIREERDK